MSATTIGKLPALKGKVGNCSMPTHTSNRIVIVGGGVAGLSIAVRLAQAGLPVTALEASRPGQGASTRNQGWLHSGAWFAPQQLEVARLCYESLQQTLQFCPECVAADPAPMTYLLSQRETDPDHWIAAWEAAGIPFERLTSDDLLRRFPGLESAQIQHAYQLPDRSMRSDLLLQRLARAAENAGAEIRSQTRVTRLIHRANSVQGVEIDSGEVISSRLVILAGGASGGALLPSFGAHAFGANAEIALVALKTHLVAASPSLSRWPLCVVDADGFNHLPHHPHSVFGTSRWSPALHGEDAQIIASQVEYLWNHVERFFPGFKREEHQTVQWAGSTAQAIRLDPVQTAQVPLPMVIDHEQESDRMKNLMSVFPGRASLWAHLAEKASGYVLERLGERRCQIALPPWEQGADRTRTHRGG